MDYFKFSGFLEILYVIFLKKKNKKFNEIFVGYDIIFLDSPTWPFLAPGFLGLSSSREKILLILFITLFSTSLFASDKKPGKFFEDQPNVTDKLTEYAEESWFKKWKK